MSNAIVVPLNEMQQLAGQWQTTINEMDTMVQQIARDIVAIPDSAKGLNDVRSRGRNVGSQHRQLHERGMAVHQHVTASVQRFAQADHELAGMVRSYGGGSYAEVLKQIKTNNGIQWGTIDSIDTLLSIGKILNAFNKLGIGLVKNSGLLSNVPYVNEMLPKLTEFMAKLNVWPTLATVDASKKLAKNLGGVLTSLSIIKDIYDSYTAYSSGDVQKGREEISNAVGTLGSFVVKRTMDVFIPGSGAALDVAQFVSDGMEYSAEEFRKNGYPSVANVVDIGADYLDMNGKFAGLGHTFFGVKDAISNGDLYKVNKHIQQGVLGLTIGYENAKGIVDFGEQTSKQVITVAGDLYKGMESKFNEKLGETKELLPDWMG